MNDLTDEAAMDAGVEPVASRREPEQLTGIVLLMAGFFLAMANFMAVLDTTIANVALPHIAGTMAASPNEGTSVITFFAVAEAITIPLTGWLAARFGTVKVFFVSMASFGICSALCGIAQSLQMLILFRVLQGLAAGPMMPLSQALLLRIVTPAQRAMATALWAMTVIVAPLIGPLLGGWIADNIGWPWAFYINVPVAAVSVIVGWRLLAPFETPAVKRGVDVVGLILLIFWVGSLQTMLDIGKTHDWFASPLIVGLLLATIVGFVAFCIWEWTDEHPIVDLKVFKNISLSIATATMALVFGVYFGSVVIIPLWLQTNLGYTATWAGNVMAFNGALAVFAAPIIGRLVTRVDPRILISIGLSGIGTMLMTRAFFTPNMTFMQLAIPQLIQGAFMPLFFLPMMTVALGSLAPKDLANGAAMITFVRTMAGAISASLMASYWEHATIVSRVDLVGNIHPEALGRNVSPSLLSNLVQGQAVMLATNHMFFIVAISMAFAAAGIWLAPKPQAMGSMGGGGH